MTSWDSPSTRQSRGLCCTVAEAAISMRLASCVIAFAFLVSPTWADEPAVRLSDSSCVFMGTDAAGWRDLGFDEFVNANCDDDTWTTADGVIRCTGKPVGVLKSKREFTNLEISLEWRHLEAAGNSGVFLWAPPAVFENLPSGKLPAGGIEVQILDHGFTAKYEKGGRKADWFTTDGDVFPVGSSTMKPFAPVSPDGRRSFPSGRHTRGTPEWNHYYVRAINGEVRLWVNGHEVSGGTGCRPATGHLCLESEGAPVEFRSIRIRELP